MLETPLYDPHGTCAENREAWQVRMQGPKDIMIMVDEENDLEYSKNMYRKGQEKLLVICCCSYI